MSTHKKIDIICIASVIFAVALTILLMSGMALEIILWRLLQCLVTKPYNMTAILPFVLYRFYIELAMTAFVVEKNGQGRAARVISYRDSCNPVEYAAIISAFVRLG